MTDLAGAAGNDSQAINARIAALEAIVRQLPARFAGHPAAGFRHISFPSAHGFTIGKALRNTGSAWVAAQADAEANAFFGGLVVSVPTPKTLVLALPGTYVRGLAVTPGINYLSATTAGALTTTAPTLKVPILMADSATSGVVLAGASGGGGGVGNPLIVGSAAVDGKIQVQGVAAAGDAIVLDASLVLSAAKKLYVYEEDYCFGGSAMKRLCFASAPYAPGT